MDGGSGTRHKTPYSNYGSAGLIPSAFAPASSAGGNRTGCMGEMGEERQVKGEDRNHAGNPWGLCLAAVSFLIFLKECSQTDSRQSAECLL